MTDSFGKHTAKQWVLDNKTAVFVLLLNKTRLNQSKHDVSNGNGWQT